MLALDRILHEIGQPGEEQPSGPATDLDLRWDVARRLNIEVRGMDPQNVLVRPHRRQVEQYGDFTHWRHPLTPEQHTKVRSPGRLCRGCPTG